MKVLGKATVRAALALCVSSIAVQASADVITYVSYGGALQEAEEAAWLDGFVAANPGTEIVYDVVDLAKLKAMVEAGDVTWDVVSVTPDFGLSSDEPLLEKIDCAIVPCDELQLDRFQTTGYRVPNLTAGVVLGYNTEAMPEGKVPAGWADFFDLDAFPGKRVVMLDTSSFVFEQALLGDGVAPEDLYPLDLDRAIAKLNTLGDNVIIAPSYQGCAELVASGEAVMGGCWNGRFYDVKTRAGAPVDFQWNQYIVGPGYFVVPKGAPNVEGAMKLIAYMLSAEQNANIASYIPYGPVNINAVDKVPAEIKDFLPSSHFANAVFPNDEWISANREEVSRRWAEWMAGVN
jgi:putative spermidine/putrescine transport system substrate-binding protein